MIAQMEGHDFIITNEDENELQKTYFSRMASLIISGAFLILFGVLQIFNIIDWIKFIGGFQ